MASVVKEIFDKLKYIKDYLTKLGPSRRSINVRQAKLTEVNILYKQFCSLQIAIEIQIKNKEIGDSEVQIITNLFDSINKLYSKIIQLCSDSTEDTENTMEKFELKTAIALLPIMTGDENITKQLISNIEMYESMIDDTSKKQLIQFVLKSRLSESAKLRMRNTYSSVADLILDMRSTLLPKKSDTAIHSKLQHMKQNDKSIENYGKELEQLFVDLTITQANGNTDLYQTLKPINERIAIKRFSDGLRNSRLSTIIAARNYSTLKDAIQGALDEKLSSGGEERVMSFHHTRGRSNRAHRNYNNNFNRGASRVFSNSQNYNNPSRGYYNCPNRARNFNSSSNYRGRGGFRGHTRFRRPARQHQIRQAESSGSGCKQEKSEVQTATLNDNLFFRA
ncbi:hypothetical protein PYW08_001853 [Mythimna loreyi]|uniref:Uncharacterized protein n=1 Tax=Mythimna loreyi TaxID=667449 RepID=A0ACC2R609_9NEOP|nr:hypothetical protein PYW08_001853 [Mythimna loreyi]